MPNIPQTRPDQSGGFMLIKYTNGQDTHRMRLHLQDFNVNGADLVYSIPGNQTETDVQATFTALVNAIKFAWDTTYTFTLDAVYRNQGPDPNRAGYNLFTELFGYTVPAAIVGAHSAAADPKSRAGMQVYNFRTIQGGRARLVEVGTAMWNANAVDTITPTSGPGPSEEGVVAYLAGAATGIVGHDGAKLNASARRTQPYNRRLRRRYGQA